MRIEKFGVPLLLLALIPALASKAVAQKNEDGAMSPTRCTACDVVQERCSLRCLDLGDQVASLACVTGCDNAAALCTLCDEPVTLRSEDVVPAWNVLTAGACVTPTTCGPEYASCASWSGYSDCNEPFCINLTKGCGENCEPGFPCPGPARYQPIQRYRACFNTLGQSCIEYSTPTSRRLTGCGC